MKPVVRWLVVPVAAWMWISVPHSVAAEPAKKSVQIAAEPAATAADEEDEYQGLPPGAGRDEALGICGACHSMKLVTQQGLSRQSWTEVIEYMVDEQEMPELDPEDHKLIVDYLSEFYGTDRRARNAPRVKKK